MRIREEYDAIIDEINRLTGLLDVERAKLTGLARRCRHPNAKSFMSGDYDGTKYMVFSCPDCGKRTEN